MSQDAIRRNNKIPQGLEGVMAGYAIVQAFVNQGAAMTKQLILSHGDIAAATAFIAQNGTRGFVQDVFKEGSQSITPPKLRRVDAFLFGMYARAIIHDYDRKQEICSLEEGAHYAYLKLVQGDVETLARMLVEFGKPVLQWESEINPAFDIFAAPASEEDSGPDLPLTIAFDPREDKPWRAWVKKTFSGLFTQARKPKGLSP